MASIIFRPPPGIDFQRGSESFQSLQSRSQSEIPETPRLGGSQGNPIVIDDKDENDNRNYIAKLWENVQDLGEDSDNESAPDDLAQVLARYPSKVPLKEDKEQDAEIENLPIINSSASTDEIPLCNRQPSSLEEDKEDAAAEGIQPFTLPNLVGASLSQVTDSNTATPISKCSTTFALDHVERLPIEQREQYASLKSIPKQVPDIASSNMETSSSTPTISKTQTFVEDKQPYPSTVTNTKLKRHAPIDETVPDIRKSGRKRTKTRKAREEDHGVDDPSLKDPMSGWPVESVEVREISLDNRELVYLINWKPSVVRCKSSKQLEGQIQETLKKQVTLKFGEEAWISWTRH